LATFAVAILTMRNKVTLRVGAQWSCEPLRTAMLCR
jgi:hypothetical protein